MKSTVGFLCCCILIVVTFTFYHYNMQKWLAESRLIIGQTNQ